MKEITFEGSCPFLFCLKTEAHSHPVCPECGAVRYGNLYCETCKTVGRQYREKELAELKSEIERRLK